MAPKKRASRTVKETKPDFYKNLTLNNVLCPICRNIFIDPVTLPCSHGFCLNCFEGTVSNANLTCPLCRVRFGSWYRLATKENRVVNKSLWDAVQEAFPDQVKNRLEGVEENLDGDTQDIIRTVASPGAIRQEYEAQKAIEDKQRQKEREAEEAASNLLIKKLKEEEEYEEIIRQEKLRLDEEIAQKLAEEIGLPSPLNANTKKNQKQPVKRKSTLDTFVLNKKSNIQVLLDPLHMNCEHKKHVKRKLDTQSNDEESPNESQSSGSDGDKECKYFKPIEPAKSMYKISPVKVPVKPKRSPTKIFRSPKGKKNVVCRTMNSAFVYFKPQIRIDFIDLSYTQIVNNNKRKLLTRSSSQKVLKTGDMSDISSIVKPPSSPLKKCTKPSITTLIQQTEQTPTTKNISAAVNAQASCSTWNCSPLSSPFRGFPVNSNNVVIEENKSDRLLQEKADRQFALRLHEELNSNGRLNRMRTTANSCRRTRQAKLEELVTPVNVAK